MGFDGSVHLPVVTAGDYSGVLASSILAYKNHGRVELAPLLARCLARSVGTCLELLELPAGSRVLLVPVPASSSGWRRRGYDPLGLLLKQMAREKRLPANFVSTPVLAHQWKLPWHRVGGIVENWRGSQQKGLGRAARRRNVANSLCLARGPRRAELVAGLVGREVIIVDDVLTTGATLQEAARVLVLAGAKVQGAVVLAATLRSQSAPMGDAEGDVAK